MATLGLRGTGRRRRRKRPPWKASGCPSPYCGPGLLMATGWKTPPYQKNDCFALCIQQSPLFPHLCRNSGPAFTASRAGAVVQKDRNFCRKGPPFLTSRCTWTWWLPASTERSLEGLPPHPPLKSLGGKVLGIAVGAFCMPCTKVPGATWLGITATHKHHRHIPSRLTTCSTPWAFGMHPELRITAAPSKPLQGWKGETQAQSHRPQQKHQSTREAGNKQVHNTEAGAPPQGDPDAHGAIAQGCATVPGIHQEAAPKTLMDEA